MKSVFLLFLFVFALIWGISTIIGFVVTAGSPQLPDFAPALGSSSEKLQQRIDAHEERIRQQQRRVDLKVEKIQQDIATREERMKQQRIMDDLKFEMQKQQGMMPGSSQADAQHQRMMEKLRLQGHQQYDTIPPRIPGQR